MPGPIVILDPTTSYDDTIKDPRQELGGDPIVPLRGLLAMQKEEKKKPEQPQPSIDDSTYSHHRNNHHMNDISMSPRLLGYVFSCISSAVAMSELESLAVNYIFYVYTRHDVRLDHRVSILFTYTHLQFLHPSSSPKAPQLHLQQQ